MPQKTLPTNPDLTHLRNQARDLQRACRAGDPRAFQWIREFHPRLKGADDARIAAAPLGLAGAQSTVARSYGFPSWGRLKAAVVEGTAVEPDAPLHERIADPVFRRAVELLDAGDAPALGDLLKSVPDLVRRRVYFHAGDYFGSPTLLQFVAENPVRRGAAPPNVVETVRRLLDAGADPNDGTLGLVVSGRVAREGGVQGPLIDLLVDRGADPDPPMLAALVHGEFAAAEALIRAGARPALPVAAALGHDEEVRTLLPLADPHGRHLALALAAQHGRTAIVRLLLDAGESPDRYNPLEAHAHSTPLHQAALAGHLDVVRLLVQRGAGLDLRDTLWNGTPLDWARHAERPEIVAFFERLT